MGDVTERHAYYVKVCERPYLRGDRFEGISRGMREEALTCREGAPLHVYLNFQTLDLQK